LPATVGERGSVQQRTLFDDEHRLFKETVQGFVADQVTPNLERFRSERRLDRSFWLAAGEAGLLGLEVPEEYGGTGIDDPRFIVVVCEELARAALAVASCVGVHVDIAGAYLVDLGTPEQQERWLPGFSSGELVTAIAMTEPDAGSDLAALTTRAQRAGDRWILNGSKTFITNGTNADLAVVAARTGEGRAGITLFAVEATSPGYAVGQKLAKIGQHEADTAELSFTDVELTDENVIGEVGAAWQYMLDRLARERLHCAYVSLAHVEAALAATLDYVKTRNAFGRPIGSFQNSRFALAKAAVSVDTARAYVDACITEYAAGRLTAVDAAKAKYYSTEIQNQVIDVCLQLHGGYGYMEEYPVARAWVDARVSRIYAGSNEIMLEIIGRSLGLGDPR
jgi:alkylation response protein AidB-like acyl-CoA dehydrogenase